MSSALENNIRLQVTRVMSGRFSSRIGYVTGYDPNRYAVKVSIQPEGIATGYIPLTTPWAGNGWGFYAAPSPGDQVAVFYEDSNFNAGFALCFFFNSESTPAVVPSGEFLVKHNSGSLLHFANDGSVALTSNTDLTATVGGKLTAIVTGDCDVTSDGNLNISASTVAVTGNLTVSETIVALGDVTGAGVSLSTHLTSAIQPGTGVSGVPVA